MCVVSWVVAYRIARGEGTMPHQPYNLPMTDAELNAIEAGVCHTSVCPAHDGGKCQCHEVAVAALVAEVRRLWLAWS